MLGTGIQINLPNVNLKREESSPMKAVRPDVGGSPPRKTSQSYSTCKVLGTLILWRNGDENTLQYPGIYFGVHVTIVPKLVYFTYLRDLWALLIKG